MNSESLNAQARDAPFSRWERTEVRARSAWRRFWRRDDARRRMV